MDIVIASWIFSGQSNITNDIKIPIFKVIHVADFGVLPDMLPVGNKIQGILDNQIAPEGFTILYFPCGSYYIEQQLDIPSHVIIKGDGGDGNCPEQTHFHFFHPNFCIHSIKITNKEFVGIEDVYIDVDVIGTRADPIESTWGNTIHISNSNNCWIRGVESFHTFRFHTEITGTSHNITVSGCYFHHARDYENIGMAYGVAIGGDSYFCRIEDNIFEHLRHSILLQGDAHQNVIGYNYSRDVHAFNGGIPVNNIEADVAFHGRPSDSYNYGPYYNLIEGNYVVRIKFDDSHQNDGGTNGPYNTIFRSKATDCFWIEKDNTNTNQYKQNIVGSDAPPHNDITRQWILDYGYSYYWDGYPNYTQIPIDQVSYYKKYRPAFFDFIPNYYFNWPIYANDLIPAKYRYDSNHGYYDPVTEPVYSGWDLYEDICTSPSVRLFNMTLNNTSADFIAYYDIEAGNVELQMNNLVVMKAKEKITLKEGFKVSSNNNYFNALIEDPCANKSEGLNNPINHINNISASKNNILTLSDDPEYNNNNMKYSKNKLLSKNDSNYKIIPNPNYGEFKIIFSENLNPNQIYVYDLLKNCVGVYEVNKDKIAEIKIPNAKSGVYSIVIFEKGSVYMDKAIICNDH